MEVITKQCDRISAVRTILKVMKFFGLWHWKRIDSNKQECQRYRILESVQRLIIHAPITFLFVTLLWIEVFTSSNLDEAGDALYMSFAVAGVIVKILNIWYYSDKAWIFMTELTLSKSFELLNIAEVELWQRKQKQFRWIILIFLNGGLFSGVAASVGVLFVNEYKLPFSYWVPFEWRTYPRNYWFAYVYNMCGIYTVCIIDVCLDMLGCYMMFHVAMLYKILGLRLAGLKALKEKDVPKELIKIFEFNTNIKRVTQECQTLISLYILSQIVLSALIICFSAYRILTMSILQNLGQFFAILQFLFVMILEIYLPCYYANEITKNSSQLCTQIYSADWLEFSVPTRKLVYLYMEFIKHSVKLKAGNYFEVGLPIFTKVINNAYTAFALLMNFEK